ncbi:hypothetical protein [Paludibacterium yongneupense]|uniref:hypothetical protein n=1 Tax=Paludibacterium yongneupense TaxID=400061 RepID=UPI0004252FA4|nr:hypothetical protein [Paludibacterium yongneupense]
MIAYQSPFFSYYTGHPLKAIGWVLTVMLTLAVTLMLDIRSALGGMMLIGVLHPVWVSMRLSDLVGRKAVAYGDSPEQRIVYVQGIPVSDTVKPLRNVLFFSAEHMRKELPRFALFRVLLYLICAAIAVRDLLQELAVWQHSPDWHASGPVVASALIGFFAWRARLCFALWQSGVRGQWRIASSTLDGIQVSAAYVSRPGDRDAAGVPYLEALLAPRWR